MDSNCDKLELFPIRRCFDLGEFNFYYPYGNTPAEDFLENVSPHSVKEPHILVLGCGDIRSCFYTLWKHFDTESAHSPLFSGVHFVLNDQSAAVLARNIIFLHFCLKRPQEASSDDFTKWLCGVWAIWFSCNLLPAHERMLSSALRDLVSHATDLASWASKDNLLGSLVQFSSECSLSKIRDVWKMWSTCSIDIQAISKRQACNFMISTSQNSDIENLVGLAVSASLSSHERTKIEHEIELSSTGNSFAECVVSNKQYLSLDQERAAKNLTMCATSDGRFILHSLLPFRCFHHGFQFSPSQIRLSCNGDKMLLDKLIVADEKFKQYPLLANSVQQFALWLSTASTFLSSMNTTKDKQHGKCSTVTFTVHCSDAIAFCNELQDPASQMRVEKKFDAIYTSNLIDVLYPPNLVLFATPLLKPHSYLFTTTIKYKILANTTQEYLENTFGVDNKMLPLLFGVRCINHEGSQYKSMVSIRPAPVEACAIRPEFTPYYVKVLVWEKVPSMVISSSAPPDSIKELWQALYSSISTILTLPPDGLNASSTLTVVKMLQTFLSHLSADDSNSQFWDPLCSLLKQNRGIDHLTNALQTHSTLSGLHLHLTVTSKTCPLCNKAALSNFFGQFSVRVEPLSNFRQANLYAQIHRPKELHSFLTFDCLASHNDGHSLRLRFIAPLHLCEAGYYVSIVSFESCEPLKIHASGPLESFSESSITYSFLNFKTGQTRSLDTSLGSQCSHYGDGDKFESIIQLSDVGYDTYLKLKKIVPEQPSPTVIKVSCGIHNLELLYPHPVEFNTLSFKISRSRRTVTVLATRACHKFEEEISTVFLANPDNAVVFPQVHLNEFVEVTLLGMQFTDDKRLLLTDLASCPPLPNLKNCVNKMMLEKNVYFTFADASQSLFVMVMVIKRVFDYQLKAPAIDLVFHVTEAKSTAKKWAKFLLLDCVDMDEINLGTIQLMEKTFQYFSKRTICSSQPKGLLALQKRVHSSFKRALVYPLYGDADDTVCNQRKTWSQIKSDPSNSESVKKVESQCCSFCEKFSACLKRCDFCQDMQVCDNCEKKYWADHTTSCENKHKINLSQTSRCESGNLSSLQIKPSNSECASNGRRQDEIEKCSMCLREAKDLKKCARCRGAQYCNKTCQKNHWPTHKTVCKSNPSQ